MNYTKNKAAINTITRDVVLLSERTDNVYESVRIIAERANQIAVSVRKKLEKKIQEFSSYTDFSTGTNENKERIEISRFFEYRPKPTLLALQEFIDDEIHFHYASEEIMKD